MIGCPDSNHVRAAVLLLLAINSDSAASAAGLAGRLVDSGSVAAETFSPEFLAVSIEAHTLTPKTFTKFVAVRIAVSCLNTVSVES